MRREVLEHLHDAVVKEDAPFSRLDAALLAEVLLRVPLQQRAANCARVSRAWREAAWAATTDIDVGLKGQKHSSLFNFWLQAHPSKASIRSLTFQYRYSDGETVRLPAGSEGLRGLQKLSALHVYELEVVLNASTSQARQHSSRGAVAGSLALLTSLTCLHVNTTAENTVGLAALTQLKELACGDLFCPEQLSHSPKHEYDEQLDAAAAVVLGQLTDALAALQALTSLELPHVDAWVGDAMHPVMQQVSCLTRLQRLRFNLQHGVHWLETLFLPQALTALTFGSCPDESQYPDISPITPCIRQLTALQELEATGCTFHMELLGSLTSLRHLFIRFSKLASAPGVPELLVLSKLTALECLELDEVDYVREEAGWTKEQEAAADSDAMLAAQAVAMAASTRLTSLLVDGMPSLAARHLFYRGQLCPIPSLRELSLVDNTPHRLMQCADAAQQMVSCCPHLTSLMLYQRRTDEKDHKSLDHQQLVGSLNCLTGLQELRSLSVCFDSCGLDSCGFDSYSAMQHAVLKPLVSMTALTKLFLQAPGLGPGWESEVLELVRCQELKDLFLECDDRMSMGLSRQPSKFTNKAQDSSLPDVWRQLLQQMVLQAAAKAGFAEDSAQQAVTAMLDGVTAPTDAVIDAARAFILQCRHGCDSS